MSRKKLVFETLKEKLEKILIKIFGLGMSHIEAKEFQRIFNQKSSRGYSTRRLRNSHLLLREQYVLAGRES